MTGIDLILPPNVNHANVVRKDDLPSISVLAILGGLCLSVLYTELFGLTEVFSFGGFTLHIMDVPLFYALGYLAFNSNRDFYFDKIIIVLFAAFTFILFVNVVRGVIGDSQAALLSARFFAPLGILPLLATSTKISRRTLSSALGLISIFASAITMLALLRTATRPDLFMINGMSVDEVNDGGRPLSSVGAFFLLSSVWFSLAMTTIRPHKKMLYRSSALFSAVGTVLSLQGTVLVSLFIGTIIFILFGFYRIRRVGLVIAAILLPIMYYITLLISDELLNIAFIAHRVDNVATRRAVWSAFEASFANTSFVNKLIGWPLGENLNLEIVTNGFAVQWQSSLHSMYYGAVKVAGICSYITFFLALFILAIRLISDYFISNSKIFLYGGLTLISAFVFFYSYEANFGTSIAIMGAIMIRKSYNYAPRPAYSYA